MPNLAGIFVLAELTGNARERVREIQRKYDPKLAAMTPPHVTLVGSSGVGSIPVTTPVEQIREALDPIARTTAPMTLQFGAPIRFMQTSIVVLPLSPHGALRDIHERIRASGLSFGRVRFTFSPHCTLSFYPTLTAQTARVLLASRVTDPAMFDRLQVYLTNPPQPSRLLLELVLQGE